ncbi:MULTISPECIES: Na+/H+ antiporter subunit E [unclassified Corynebacterium]|uniref:Na+/H+ antiporter subunit E n=1 Tax=unclassified Corynebacterium TaxID=2624378 RepID=UPI002A914E8B|nr:Na+/H+ antiporter subunit E [Corynebacterium sp.]MDY5784736.1 Na+/H+ antiporter subunit E [Corynebacterium sp.]
MSGIAKRFHPSFVLWLTVMWILLQGELTWGNLIAGVSLATIIVLALPLPQVPVSDYKIHYGKLFVFLLQWIGTLITASIKVAWLALRPQEPPRNAILRVPMRVSNDLVLYLATCFYNLQPGGSVSDIDIANREWTIHVLDAETEDDIDREINNVLKLERQMIDIFESRR